MALRVLGRSRPGGRKWLAIAAAVALVAAAVVVGAVLARGNGATVSSAPAGSRGTAAPSLSGTSPIDGRQVSLAAFAGKPVVINIWASWCPGCNEEAADLRRFAAAHPEAQVLGLDIQDTRGGARGFYRRWAWKHPSIFDPDGSIAARFGLQGLPTTLFLNKEHRIVGRIVGAGDLGRFNEGLRRAEGA
jgi:thiol-disulfide isomerase/thioredoxin